MVGQIQICNMALLELGADTIENLSEPYQSNEAKACATFWDTAYDYVLTDGGYNFCRIHTGPPTLDPAGDPMGLFSSVYHLPNDPFCIRVSDVRIAEGVDMWKVNGRRLFTNSTVKGLAYIGRVDLANMPGHVARPLSLYLAHAMAYTLTESNQVEAAKFVKYERFRDQAQTIDNWEGNWRTQQSDDLNLSRHRYVTPR